MSEDILWKGSPSQILNLGKHLVGVLLLAGIGVGGAFFPPVWFAIPLPLLWMLWNYLKVRCRVYELTNERLRLYDGVLNQTIDELELYRVKDTTMDRPFWFRMFGLSTLHLDTSDRSHPKVDLEAIADGVNLRETLRKQVEHWRDRKRVREVDFEDGDDMEGDGLDI
ncbi:membrane-flanked domain-containing protein [Haloferula helveola]|uniref:Membrane-flanked domain-containing protein n=1 Tax=Haloferula helveola TaxID=490095 RepID=A0ABN6H2F0_9BACT|nr:membrane-flanked domain-containing protein [Haloferula helveola]